MSTLKHQIIAFDYIVTGSVIRKFGPCGKKECRCSKNRKFWHGPYYIWTRKENGKTVTKSLTLQQARLCQKAIRNTKKLNALIEWWRRESVKAIIKQTDAGCSLTT